MKKLILAATSATAMLALSACGDAAEEPMDETTVVDSEMTEPMPAETPLTEDPMAADPAMDPAMDPAADPMSDSAAEEAPAEDPEM